ncbi:hypothetical protein QFC20_000109 [Naganishia adeliensis]|uniref:Uncharacterized protein n=1 Tax=Naganishia adeliensis TaxID=92952 RepID=A0ACC2X335_9TREE|nr:hypothetical protein QFC20_000109 [Naganishia adeliensis]
MDDSIPVTGLQTSGSVSSRFVSQNELDEAKKRKDEEWKAAYARLGQEPPPQQEETEYDPRSLYERLSTQKETKKEEWDAKMRMANQFRGLEADELQFLDETGRVERERQRKVEMQDAEQLAAFKRLQSRQGGLIEPPIEERTAPALAPVVPSVASTKPAPAPAAPSKRNVKSLLKGVIKKKDTKTKESVEPVSNPPATVTSAKKPASASVSTPESNSRKRSAPALGVLGGYDSDDSEASGSDTQERDTKKIKV